MTDQVTLDLLETSPPIIVKPALAVEIGLNEAIVLQQLAYWLERSDNVRDGKVWAYKTHEEWAEELPFFSVSTIKRTVASLRNMGLVETTDKHNRMSTDRTLWYTIPGWRTPKAKKRATTGRKAAKVDEGTHEPGTEHKRLLNGLCVVLHGVDPSDPAAAALVPWGKLAGFSKKLRDAGVTPEVLWQWFRTEWPNHWAYKQSPRPSWVNLRDGVLTMVAEAAAEQEPVEEVLDL